jgi:hypothetical protein
MNQAISVMAATSVAFSFLPFHGLKKKHNLQTSSQNIDIIA